MLFVRSRGVVAMLFGWTAAPEAPAVDLTVCSRTLEHLDSCTDRQMIGKLDSSFSCRVLPLALNQGLKNWKLS
ncbi:hypothetical protein B0H66DRAFT_565522 [Apodospora peruviana]|uniref:Secreted protein n=1 Tax=Apodospora peruviana TaxID=516989 RepID=A0AAE0M2G4_9PEZI|nr:hypothetical protein B0H66DRAFT_565522 [Apodospora peruviana]